MKDSAQIAVQFTSHAFITLAEVIDVNKHLGGGSGSEVEDKHALLIDLTAPEVGLRFQNDVPFGSCVAALFGFGGISHPQEAVNSHDNKKAPGSSVKTNDIPKQW